MHPKERVILLRHDVDARKEHSFQFAKIQHDMGIVGTYYFRMVPQSFDKGVIREIAAMGHEIGYHYEDMDVANGDPDKSIKQFEKNLEKLRSVADVKTICMHGSPLSKYDNRELWKHYDYRDYGIIAEPYFDLDFSKVFYLTDTGRRWDGEKVSIRDRAPEESNFSIHDSEQKRESSHTSKIKNLHFCSTYDIIEAVESGSFPDQVMMNFHPQRWTDNISLWTQELILQNVKNVVKFGLNKIRR